MVNLTSENTFSNKVPLHTAYFLNSVVSGDEVMSTLMFFTKKKMKNVTETSRELFLTPDVSPYQTKATINLNVFLQMQSKYNFTVCHFSSKRKARESIVCRPPRRQHTAGRQ
jgi:hypothetical protein